MKEFIVLKLKVPRGNETGPIVAENIFSTLHAFDKKDNRISFEIANIGGIICFYLALPEGLVNFVEAQIYAQYPDVEIERCLDYAMAPKNKKNATGVELKLMHSDIFPIKRYSQFEDKLTRLAVDPIAGITAALHRLNHENDQMWIQVVVSPLSDKWRIVFTRCVRLLKRGVFKKIEFLENIYAKLYISRNIWIRLIFFPLYTMFWFQGVFGSSSVVSGQKEMEELSLKAHERENDMEAAMDKVIRPLYKVTIRIVYLSQLVNEEKSKIKLRELVGSFKQFSFPHSNGFNPGKNIVGENVVNLYNKRWIRNGMVLNNEELATIYHLPGITVKTPGINWVKSKKMEAPLDLPYEGVEDELAIIGKTDFRGLRKVFGIKATDRQRHLYIIGKTGMGKSTLLENMIYSDILSGKGVGLIDPHGDLADSVLNFIPDKRINDVVLIDPSDKEYAVAFNILENVDSSLNSIICSGLIGIFKKIYMHSWGPRLEHILRNTVLLLLESPGSTMLWIPRILQDDDFRKKLVSKVKDPLLKNFWSGEFDKMQEKLRIEAISPILNKVGQFLADSTIRSIVGQPKSKINLRLAMDKGKIVIINLSKGKIGEDNSALLGSMFVTKFQLDSMSRADIPHDKRKDFYLYVDEFQNFATESFVTILSEARKYKLNLTMANQYIAQVPEEIRDAVFGNVGSILAFQLGYDDAEYVALQFGDKLLSMDLVSLNKYNAYMKMLIDGIPSNTFSLSTLSPPLLELENNILKIRKVSRERYSDKIDHISERIQRWSRK